VAQNVIEMLAHRRVATFIEKYNFHSRNIFVGDDGSLIHSSEFGQYRERLVKELLSDFLPRYVSLGEGFICNKNSKRSTQCDIVIYNREETPNLESDDLRRFFPIETLYGVGEVKSKLSVYELKKAAKKLQNVKKVRWDQPSNSQPINGVCVDDCDERRFLPHDTDEEIYDQLDINVWNPKNKEFQNIVTFIVCESIDLKNKSMLDVARTLYKPSIENEPVRHNFILSLRDGLMSYITENSNGNIVPYSFPHRGARATGYRYVEPDSHGSHVLAFLSGMVDALSKTCIYRFNIKDYIKDFSEQNAPMT